MIWTYEEYWNCVLGICTASQIVEEFALTSCSVTSWLIKAETETWRVGGHGDPLPPEWPIYRDRALAALKNAASEAQKAPTIPIKNAL
jgi:hypothetical protein